MKHSFPMNKNAFALSIVLWIVAALLFGVAMLSTLSKDTLTLTKGVDEKLASQLIAEDILEYLKFYIPTANYDSNSFINSALDSIPYGLPNQLIVDNRWYDINESVKIRLQDTSALINVFYIDGKKIANLATTALQRQERFVINDSIKDWTDSDNVVSLNGAEASRYELQEGVNFKIRNSPALQSIEELQLIRGVDTLKDDEWNKLKDRLYYGSGAMVNLSLIDANYLAYLLAIDISKANTYINLREVNMIEYIKAIQKEEAYDYEIMGFFLSKQLKIEIRVTSENSTSILKTLINLSHSTPSTYSYSLN